MQRFASSKVITRGMAIKATGGAESIKIPFDTPYEFHKVPKKLQPKGKDMETTAEEMLTIYEEMQTVRRIEVASNTLYKQRMIRGFLHLCNGQEAVYSGMEAALERSDHIITAYREHGIQLCRGDTPESILSELMGKSTGCAHGKGGSMHMYHIESNFYGGNGIVGAQVPIGAGIAFTQKFKKTGNISVGLYGDGAANQGQIFEAFNIAKLWDLPAIFVCENNGYGMGTSAERSSASTEYFTRGDYVPGIKVDGMNVFNVKHSFEWAKKYVLEHGPLVMEMKTYRYMGHSMSDPGISYRTKEEVKEVQTTRDPIQKLKQMIIENGVSTEADMKALDKTIRKRVDQAVEFAKEAPWPEPDQLYSNIYAESVPVRGRTTTEGFQ